MTSGFDFGGHRLCLSYWLHFPGEIPRVPAVSRLWGEVPEMNVRAAALLAPLAVNAEPNAERETTTMAESCKASPSERRWKADNQNPKALRLRSRSWLQR